MKKLRKEEGRRFELGADGLGNGHRCSFPKTSLYKAAGMQGPPRIS